MSKPITSDQDKTDEHAHSKSEGISPASNTLPPFSRQFSSKLLALGFSVVIALLLAVVLFWQNNQQTQSVIKTQLLPLQQQVKQLASLQQAKFIVDELLRGDSEKNWLKLHADLIALNRQLLRLNSNHASIYQQWFNNNKVAKDTVERVEKNKSRNQQLKQSSVIQLQLMLFSISSISDTKSNQQKELYKQLQTDRKNGTVTLSRANAYVEAVKQAQKAEQLKYLLTEMLTGFERLTLRTSQIEFDLLRLGVEQLFAQAKLLQSDNTKTISEFFQQVNSFKGIVITEQMALAKWQGYLRIMQSYNLDLDVQKQQIIKLLSESQAIFTSNSHSSISLFLANNNIHLSNNEISLILIFAIGVTLATFCILLWRVRQQIRAASQQSLALIKQSIQGDEACITNANCHETHEIILQIQAVTKPEYNKQDYQMLLSQVQLNERVIQEQKQAFEQLTENSDEQELEKSVQVAEQFSHELQRYGYLKSKVLPKLIETQINDIIEEKAPSLNHVYDTLELFELASYLQSENAILTLHDVNLLEELHSILLNKQAEQLASNNQLFISYDEKIISQSNFDIQLFQYLANLLVDLCLQQCNGALFHLHLQLQDKNAGQQIIRFVVKVYAENLTQLPDTIKQLVHAKEKKQASSSFIEIFKIFLTQLHGENVVAQLIDGGYLLSFDIPFTIASTGKKYQAIEVEKAAENVILAETKVMLLSANKVVNSIIKKLVLACAGKFEVIARMDSFSQLMNVKHLSRHKLDLLVVASDIAVTELSLIKQQIASLPKSLQPKLMILQSSKLNYQKFGFYSQAEQPLCKVELLHNITELLAKSDRSNQLFSADEFQNKPYINSQLRLLLAAQSPQKYQKLQRLLQWLGLQVDFVCDETTQTRHWQTGRYCILITEFPEMVWLDMSVLPCAPVGIFSLLKPIALPDTRDSAKNTIFNTWYCGQLSLASSLAELESTLSPWLKPVESTPLSSAIEGYEVGINADKILNDDMLFDSEELENLITISEVATTLATGYNSEAVFDFSRYLHHQGSAELALFMLDDYSQDNHQQLTQLAEAIEGKNFEKAKMAVESLQLNANILAANDLQQLCSQWLHLLNNDQALTEIKNINALLKDSQQALNAIDSYAQTI